jgi:hypothetical protein
MWRLLLAIRLKAESAGWPVAVKQATVTTESCCGGDVGSCWRATQ